MVLPAEKTLIVEGNNDAGLLSSILQYHGLITKAREVDIEVKGSREAVIAAIPSDVTVSGRRALGIVIDADDDVVKAWREIAIQLESEAYNLHSTFSQNGTIIQPPAPDKPLVGIWIMPNNKSEGAIEHFCEFLIVNDALWQRTKNVVDDIPAEERRFKDKPRPKQKAYIHTWLAWQEEPGQPMGKAVIMKYLNANVPEVNSFIAWAKELFFDHPFHQAE